MNDYSQPDFYRFNQDSLRLVRWIIDRGIVTRHLIDLGAGCGIIGLELARTLRPEKLTLLELQAEYLPHLKLNVEQFLPAGVKADILIKSFSEINSEEQFDLIVCNPPYYLPHRGQVSANTQRALARSFLVDDWSVLWSVIDKSLCDKGKAFLVIKNDQHLIHEITSKNRKNRLQIHDLGDIQILEISHSE